MKIISKTPSRSDLFEIIFQSEKIELDRTLAAEFSKEDAKLVSLEDLQAGLKNLALQAPQKATKEFEVLFARAYHLFLLLSILKNKGQFRLQLSEFLVWILNNEHIHCVNYYSEPYNVMCSFYGEYITNTNNTAIPVPQFPGLNINEKEILTPLLTESYYYALSTVNLLQAQTILSLGEAAFSMFCEQNYIKSDFLKAKYEKRSNNKFVSPTANNISNLVSGSQLNKYPPTKAITTWIDLVAHMKADIQQSLNSILEEYNTDEAENSEEPAMADCANFNAKDMQFFNHQSFGFINSTLALIENSLKRLNESREVVKQLSPRINSLSDSFSQMRKKLFAVSSATTPNTQELGFMKYAHECVDLFHQIIVMEALNSFYYLQTLSNGKRTPLGKGTKQLYALFDEEFYAKLPDKDVFDESTIGRFSEFFSPSNAKLQQLIEEIVSPKNNERRKPKIPKGTCDMDPPQMAIRRIAIDKISSIFRKHGAVEIDTPVFELRETLMGKYGENSKLIYDLQDQGGEQLSLRYDLTVPFARYVAVKGNITSMKRLHIAKVYRRDQPQIKKGRFREFYQCDYDIVGNFGMMIPDAECVIILNEIFSTLDIGKVSIKVNHRKLLDAMVEISGAPSQKFKAICSSVDKLDKEPWSEIRKELINEKGITEEAADKLGEFVLLRGNPIELFEKLSKEEVFKGSKEGENALKEMGILFKYLQEVNCTENVSFDLSLARGLDYYTGLIYEAVLEDNAQGLGSIAGGGRYDELIGMFSNKSLPAVGLSIGIERVFGLLEKKHQDSLKIRACETEVLVASIGSGMTTERFKLCKMLWDNNIKTEMLFNENPKSQKQLDYALENKVPFIIWIGENEIKNNSVKIKALYKGEESTIPRDELLTKLKEMLGSYNEELANGVIGFKKMDEKVNGKESL